jgi:hypothetical protein
MKKPNLIDFMTILGEEFCEALSPTVGWDELIPQDSYEIFCRTFNQKPSLQMLASLSESQLELLRINCEEYLECQNITVDHVRAFVAGTLARWPMVD